ncbi:MAG: metallophosphoesterase [Spirochaetaceae bacterium]|nr:metallophosphoesterase [Spirochaetaceae bacterium]
MKKSTKTSGVLFSLGICLFVSFFCAWLKASTGFNGFLKWTPNADKAFEYFLISAWLPFVLYLLYTAFSKKKQALFFKFLSLLLSGIYIVICVTAFFFLSITGTIVSFDPSTVNILPSGESLPDRSKTVSDTEPLLRLGFSGDPHWGSNEAQSEIRTELLQNIGAQHYDAFFILGDIADFGTKDEYYENALADIAKNMPSTPIRFVMGNSDAKFNTKRQFSKAFLQNDKNLYSHIYAGHVHILILNLLWDAEDFNTKQKKWFLKEISLIPESDTVIVVSHCQIVASGYYTKSGRLFGESHDLIGRLSPYLEKYKADLVISGHCHFMEYLEKNDISYAVAGTMGGKLDSTLDYISPWSKWLSNLNYGWLEVEVFRTFFTFTFYGYDGTVLASASRDTVTD